jgi:selenocysteine lyase/cysteine desulfurase
MVQTSDRVSSGAAIRPIHSLAELRADIALTRACAYFQTGSEGPVSDSTQHVLVQALRDENHAALLGSDAYARLAEQAERSRGELAALINVAPEEVAWLSNTSSAVRFAVSSLPWQPGDRLAISSIEHVSTRILARGVEQITGQVTTVIPAGNGGDYRPERFLEALAEHLTPDHRLVILSHVSCLDGRRLPVAGAVRLAQSRGVKVLVDGAQAVGQFTVDAGGIDAEFYAGSLHKWLLGPAGLGYLVVNRRQLPDYHPLLMPHPYPREDGQAGERLLSAGGQTEVGTESLSLRLGAGAAIATVQRIGVEAIAQHVCPLVRRMRDGLGELPGLEVISPASWELASGILAIRLNGFTPQQVRALVARIWQEAHVVVKFQPEYAGIRVSVAGFNIEAEVERLLAALARLLPARS